MSYKITIKSIKINYLLLLLVIAQQIFQVRLWFCSFVVETQHLPELAHFQSIRYSLTCHNSLDLFNHVHCLPSYFAAFFWDFRWLHGSGQGIDVQRWVLTKRSLYFIFSRFGPFVLGDHGLLLLITAEMPVDFANEVPVFSIGHFRYFKHLINDRYTSKVIFLISSEDSPSCRRRKLIL